MKVFIIAYIMQFGNNLNLYNKYADKLMYFSFVQLIYTCTVHCTVHCYRNPWRSCGTKHVIIYFLFLYTVLQEEEKEYIHTNNISVYIQEKFSYIYTFYSIDSDPAGPQSSTA